MRIVSGKYRRRKLLTNEGLVTRPITDRVKETLFQHLADDIVDQHVADVFAGTGTIGLEALSRGASTVVFIESHREAHQLLLRNVELLQVQEETMCWRTNVMRTSFRPRGYESFYPYDVMFFDPPYRMIPKLLPGSLLYKSLERVAKASVTSDDAQLILRTPLRAEFECPPYWQPCEMFSLSTMEIHVFQKVSSPQPAETTDD